MTDTVRRVVVHCPSQQLSADLVLPARCPVAVLLPALVDGVLGDDAYGPEPARWSLTPAVGLPLDPAKSLHDNGVRDGDLMLLTDEPAPPPRVHSDAPTGAVITAGREPAPRSGGWEAAISAGVLLSSAAALGWAGSAGGQESALWVGAAIALAAAVVAVAGWVAAPVSDALGVGAACHAAVTGALAAAGFSWMVVVAFAAAAALAVSASLSISLGGSRSGSSPAMIGCTAAGGAVLPAATIGALTAQDALGPLVTGMSLAGLAGAGSLAAAAAGIGPARRAVGTRRAQLAHRLLTGLIAGWAGTAIAGIAVTAVALPERRTATGAFAALVGLVLILRHRVHADPVRRRTLIASGLAALGIALSLAVIASPWAAPWLCGGITIAGAALLRLGGVTRTPLAQSIIRGVDYTATAAVVPLAAWLAGVYDAAHAVSLT